MFSLGGDFFFILIFYFSPREEADWVSHGTAGSASGAEAARALKLPFFVFDTRQYSSTSYKALSYSTHPHP